MRTDPPRPDPTTVLRDRRAWRLLLCATALTGLSSCGQRDDLAGPEAPALRVTTATGGGTTDPDGYTLVIDGHGAIPMAALDTVLETGLTPGDHTTDLQGVAAGCSVQDGASRSVTAVEGTTVAVDFSVTCTAAEPVSTGAIGVTLTTSGVDLDPDGYLLTVDPSMDRAVGITGQARFDDVTAGTRGVRLSGLAANCSIQGENPRTVDVPPAGEAEVAFAVRCWPPPSGRIAYREGDVTGRADRLSLVGADGTALPGLFFEDLSAQPSWSPPDARLIAFVDRTVFVLDPESEVVTALPECLPGGRRPSWSPNGQRILCVLQPIFEVLSLVSMRRDGTDVRELAPGMRVLGARYVSDGAIVFIAEADPQHRVFRIPAGGGTPIHVSDLPDDVSSLDPAVPSQDGSRLLYVRERVSRRHELYVAGVSGNDPRLLSADLDVIGSSPAWSPDGSHVALVAIGPGQADELWVVNADGSNLIRVDAPGPVDSNSPLDWSPDGTRVVFSVLGEVVEGQTTRSLYTVRADGSGIQRVTAQQTIDTDPAWGP